MFWQRMTKDEFATSQQEEGLNAVKKDGIWWLETRPFFFRPLFPFEQITPWSKRYPLKSLAGGFLHLVPPGKSGNSNLNLFVYEDLKNYSLDILSSKRKGITKQGMRNFTARAIPDAKEFIATAYDVYISFHNRTGYSYKEDRVKREAFASWARNLYKNPKSLKLGAYDHGKLSAVEISYFVEDVIIGETFFSDDASLNLKVTDFVVHTLRKAATETDAKYLFLGFPSGVDSLDESKLIRGCRLLRMPAYCKINPLALAAARLVFKESYRKFSSMTRQISGLPGSFASGRQAGSALNPRPLRASHLTAAIQNQQFKMTE
jgi:hypothetical protein